MTHQVLNAFAPGRTEIAGNHVDHQHGVILAATVSDGISATIRPTDNTIVKIVSEGYPDVILDVSAIAERPEPAEGEQGTSKALARGVLSEFAKRGFALHGFEARAKSTLPAGGGLSSSAAYELLIGVIANELFAKGALSEIELAQIGKTAEVEFFGKPCGLMDQTVIALGGLVLVDFADPQHPLARRLDCDFTQTGLDVCLVDVHCDHSNFGDEFAAIPADMKKAAKYLGANVLGDLEYTSFLSALPELRKELGDDVALRAMHYYREVASVRKRAAGLESSDVAAFLEATALSAASSAQYLQNVSKPGAYQPAMVALALADTFLDRYAQESKTRRGVARIHGGGFGGTIQVYLPTEFSEQFAHDMDEQLGTGSVKPLVINGRGAYVQWA